MDIPQRIGLQLHHIDILIRENRDNYKKWEDHMKFMYVEWYPIVFPGAYCLNKESVSRMADFFRELSKSSNTEIEVVDRSEEDSVCGLCDNLINEECKYGEGNSLDKKAQLRYNLSFGEVRTVGEFLDGKIISESAPK